MDTKQALAAIKKLSEMPYSDETVLSALDRAIKTIRAEALIQCDEDEVKDLQNT